MVHIVLQHFLCLFDLKGVLKMIGFYNYTVILTYIGMLMGFTGITFALNGDVHTALICLMAAGVCDMFDGKIASTMDRTVSEKHFGIQIDSLSDLICFGILPAIIVYTVSGQSTLSFCVSGLYVLAALIRLAWFNVDEQDRQSISDGPREYYLGLPVTSAALLIPIAVEVINSTGLSAGRFFPLVLFATGAAFLCPFRLKKPALLGKISMIAVGSTAMTLLFLGFDI